MLIYSWGCAPLFCAGAKNVLNVIVMQTQWKAHFESHDPATALIVLIFSGKRCSFPVQNILSNICVVP